MRFLSIDLGVIPKSISVGIWKFEPPSKHFRRTAKEHIIYFITSGSLVMKVNDEIVELEKGDVYFFKCGDTQEAIRPTKCEYFYIHFSHDNVSCFDTSMKNYLADYKERCSSYKMVQRESNKRSEYFNIAIPQKISLKNKNTFNYMVEKYKKLFSLYSESNFEKRMGNAFRLFEVLLALEKSTVYNLSDTKRANKSFNTVQNVLFFLEKNYTLEINRNVIEEKFGFNYDYLNRIFKSETGDSIVKYRNKLRIDRAKFLLSSTFMSIEEVAEAVGFNDKYYFSRCFSMLAGMPPARYRLLENSYNKKD